MWSFMFSSLFCFRTARSIVIPLCTAMIACRYFELYWPQDPSFWSSTIQNPTTKQTRKVFVQEEKKGAWHQSAVIWFLIDLHSSEWKGCSINAFSVHKGLDRKLPLLHYSQFQLGTSLLFLDVQWEISVACSVAGLICKNPVHMKFLLMG